MKALLFSVRLLAVVPSGFSTTTNFDSDTVGQLPADWSCGKTGKGSPRWSVEADDSAPSRPNVLKQSGTAAFPWCVRNDIKAGEGVVG